METIVVQVGLNISTWISKYKQSCKAYVAIYEIYFIGWKCELYVE